MTDDEAITAIQEWMRLQSEQNKTLISIVSNLVGLMQTLNERVARLEEKEW